MNNELPYQEQHLKSSEFITDMVIGISGGLTSLFFRYFKILYFKFEFQKPFL